MSGSYKKLNYSLRPAKSVERKMLLEGIRRLSPFGSVGHYRYVGFGSPYFADFILFHNQLGICNMISIEADEQSKERFEHNKPFGCIRMQYGKSTDVLPKLEDWSPRSIYWLDYDGRLNASVLTDVECLSKNASLGSLIIFAVNADPRDEGKRLTDLRNKIGDRHIPHGVEDDDLMGWGTAKICRRIINNKVEETLNARSVGGHAIRYRQLFNFHYSDGAMMLCTGGIIYDDGQAHLLSSCGFEQLEFLRSGEEAFLIEIPKLTRNELRYLNCKLPGEIPTDQFLGIPPTHVENYAKLYRYFPVFSEVES